MLTLLEKNFQRGNSIGADGLARKRNNRFVKSWNEIKVAIVRMTQAKLEREVGMGSVDDPLPFGFNFFVLPEIEPAEDDEFSETERRWADYSRAKTLIPLLAGVLGEAIYKAGLGDYRALSPSQVRFLVFFGLLRFLHFLSSVFLKVQ